jgi:cobalt/nickel transport system permease protein
MTIVLVVQCLLFADGGITALGANVVNMALLAVFAASAIYTGASRVLPGPRGQLLGAALAGWMSVMVAACACSLELAASGAQQLLDVLSPMAAIHSVIGLSEALLTAAAVALMMTAQWNKPLQQGSGSSHGRILAGLGIALAIVILLAPWASSAPDGLESVAAALNMTASETHMPLALAPDYLWPGIDWEPLSVAMAGVLGVGCVFLTTRLVGRAALGRKATSSRAT